MEPTPITKTLFQEFCILWGFDVEDEDHNSMSYSLYPKMKEDAEDKHGISFCAFMRTATDTTDGFTYLNYTSWDKAWKECKKFIREQEYV